MFLALKDYLLNTEVEFYICYTQHFFAVTNIKKYVLSLT